MTSNDVSDDTAILHRTDALDGVSLGNVLADGAYDTMDCREAIHDRAGQQVIPRKKSARVQRLRIQFLVFYDKTRRSTESQNLGC